MDSEKSTPIRSAPQPRIPPVHSSSPPKPVSPTVTADKAGDAVNPASPNPTGPITLGSESSASSKETSPAEDLSPEEQMRLFEKELKEKDWGHQPC